MANITRASYCLLLQSSTVWSLAQDSQQTSSSAQSGTLQCETPELTETTCSGYRALNQARSLYRQHRAAL